MKAQIIWKPYGMSAQVSSDQFETMIEGTLKRVKGVRQATRPSAECARGIRIQIIHAIHTNRTKSRKCIFLLMLTHTTMVQWYYFYDNCEQRKTAVVTHAPLHRARHLVATTCRRSVP